MEFRGSLVTRLLWENEGALFCRLRQVTQN